MVNGNLLTFALHQVFEEKDFQKFSKVLHIKKDEAEGATSIIYKLQNFYELKLWVEKNGYGPKL